MDAVVHFEMPYDDARRVAAFYSSAFGWDTKALGAEMGDYVLADTTETDAERMVKTPGQINGGFFKKSKPDQGTRLTIAVDDIQAAMEREKASGGQPIGGMKGGGEPDEIPGVGLYATCIDTEGNDFSLLQPKKML